MIVTAVTVSEKNVDLVNVNSGGSETNVDLVNVNSGGNLREGDTRIDW